jgi:hypothetical protein
VAAKAFFAALKEVQKVKMHWSGQEGLANFLMATTELALGISQYESYIPQMSAMAVAAENPSPLQRNFLHA